MLSCHVCSIPFLLRNRFSTYPIQILRQNYVVILHTFFQLLTDVLFILVSTGRTCTQDWGKAEKRANLTNCKVIQVELCKRLFRTSWNKQCNCKAYKSAGNRYKVWGGDSSEAMGAAREGKMEENSLNKYNRSPPLLPFFCLLPRYGTYSVYFSTVLTGKGLIFSWEHLVFFSCFSLPFCWQTFTQTCLF